MRPAASGGAFRHGHGMCSPAKKNIALIVRVIANNQAPKFMCICRGEGRKANSVYLSVGAIAHVEDGPIAHLAVNSSKVSSACSLRRGIEVLKARTIRGWAAGRAVARMKVVEPRTAARSMVVDGIAGDLLRSIPWKSEVVVVDNGDVELEGRLCVFRPLGRWLQVFGSRWADVNDSAGFCFPGQS
jgi:hypothetical protein